MYNNTGMMFGTAGTPAIAKGRGTEAGIEYTAELGLECMEVEFVYGVKMSENAAISIGELAAVKGIVLTVHAPYYINLNAVEPEKILASKERIMHSARLASLLGARSVTFHAAFYLKSSPADTYYNVKRHLQSILNILRGDSNQITISPELTGKPGQFGSLEELLSLAAELEGVAPCFDFSHWHARTGRANSYSEFIEILGQVENRLGRPALENMHIHVSGIDFGQKGERKHVMLSESDFNYIDLLRALKDCGSKGVIICESAPHMERDALLLQQTYRQLGS